VVESPNCLPEQRFWPLLFQIVAQTNCRGGREVISSMANVSQIDVSELAYPFLVSGAWSSLKSVASSSFAPLDPMRVTRAWQPFLEQYYFFRRGTGCFFIWGVCFLYSCSKKGFLLICGVSEEVPYVGTTVWERGATVELANADDWAAAFAANPSWTRVGLSFTYSGPDTLDAGTRAIQTFQLMWNVAFPDATVATTGRFDSKTQVATEQAAASGIVFSGLCSGAPANRSYDQVALLLIIIVPLAVLGFLVFVFVVGMQLFFGSQTPFDGGGGKSVLAPLYLPETLHNSVEDTSVLSEYARSDEGEDDTTKAEEDETSGIWEED
jgi:hypothetical protein